MRKAIFLQGDLKKHILHQATPSIISLITTFSFALADTVFIARLGAAPLTAIGFIFGVMELVIGIGLGLGIAATTCVGHMLGAQRFQRAKHFATAALIGTMLISLLLVVLGLILTGPLFRLLGATPNVMPYIYAFTNIWYFSIPLILAFFLFGFTLRSYGFAKLMATLSILLSLLNLGLDPILIFGLFGAPKLGVSGAAWAGLISRLIMAGVTLYYLKKYNVFAPLPSLKLIGAYWQRLCKVALPATFTNLVPPISITLTTFLLADISQNAVAAYGLASKIQWLAVIPMLSVSGAISPIVAQNFGAKQFSRSIETFKISAQFSLLWGALSWGLLALTASSISHSLTHVQDIANICNDFLYIVPFSFAGWGIVMMTNSTFNAIGRPMYSALITSLRMLIIFLPLALLLKWFFADRGIFAALAISNWLVAGMAWWLMRRHTRRMSLPPSTS